MIKKWMTTVLMLSLALGLTACGSTSPEKPEQPTEQPTEQTAQDPAEKAESVPLDHAEYTIETKDHSIRTADGTVCVEQTYDLITLTGEGAVVEAINQNLQEEYDAYVADLPSDEDEIQSYRDSFDTYALCNTVSADVTYNENGIFSVVYSQEWFMGGVANLTNTTCLYDLKTGNRMTAAQALGMDDEAMTCYLKDNLRRYIFQKYQDVQFFEDVDDIINSQYTLDTMNYYISGDGELTLSIPPYDLAPGYVGGFEVPCGLYLDSSKNRQVRDFTSQLSQINSWTSYPEAPDCFLNLSFAADGSCEICLGVYETDFFFAWSGTYTINANGLLTIDAADSENPSAMVHWVYQCVPAGQGIQLVQIGSEGILTSHTITLSPESVE